MMDEVNRNWNKYMYLKLIRTIKYSDKFIKISTILEYQVRLVTLSVNHSAQQLISEEKLTPTEPFTFFWDNLYRMSQ